MKNIVVLVSGGGTNLQRIIDTIKSNEIANAQVSLVVADRDCYGLQRAENEGIKNKMLPRGKNFCELLEKEIPENVDLIVLAGFLSIMTQDFCQKFEGKIINIHPALLPKFGGKGMWGMHVHNAVIAADEKTSGATVHFVTAGVDEGEIILQGKVDISENDTPESLAEKIHSVEYDIFPKAINIVLQNK
jgi:phosphoribosylglycinamide formyltransferase-1